MGIETAFLLGVLLGHWIMLLALWRASLKVLKILVSMQSFSDDESASGTEIIYVPLNDDSDNDW